MFILSRNFMSALITRFTFSCLYRFFVIALKYYFFPTWNKNSYLTLVGSSKTQLYCYQQKRFSYKRMKYTGVHKQSRSTFAFFKYFSTCLSLVSSPFTFSYCLVASWSFFVRASRWLVSLDFAESASPDLSRL